MAEVTSSLHDAYAPADRRIGQRVPTSGLTMGWHPALPEKKRLGGKATRRGTEAEILDLSLSGARVKIVENDQLYRGCEVGIGLRGGRGTASVRRVEDGAEHETIYGIQFLQLDATMRDAVNELVVSRNGHH